MEAFRKQVADAEAVLAQLSQSINTQGSAGAEVQRKLSALIPEESAIRPFLAALATSDLPLDDNVLKALKTIIESKPEQVKAWHILLTKNIIMSAVTALAHERSGRPVEGDASRAVTTRMGKIVGHIAGASDLVEAKWAAQAIDNFEPGKEYTDTGESEEIYWHKFFSQWKYNKEDLKLAQKHLLQKS